MQDLIIAGIQSELHWEDIDANLAMFSEKIDSISENVDLIILPETFSTGFSMNHSIAESMDEKAVTWIVKKAKERKCCITGSILIKENDEYFNRMIIAKEDGNYLTYDKRHLFSFAKEDKYFSSGEKRLVFELKGWRICPLICYDLRFPVWSKNNEEIDLYFYVANWPAVRSNAWDILLKARAIENVSYVTGINRVGFDFTNKHYGGNSSIIDFKGQSIFDFPLDKNHIEISTLNKQKLNDFRAKFPALNDGDNFEIKR
ncbi:amidohydrolase [Flavobacteriales bacterium]|nr:amidohydrolase [Flavobacteriales bacterium]